MSFSRNEIIGAVFSFLVVAAMGVITFTGPYHIVSKPSVQASSQYPPITVKMLTDPRTIGKFSPDPVYVHVGQKITWVNDSNADHTVDATNGPFHSGNVSIGASYSWVAAKPGRYPYKCVYHLLMVGTLVVLRPGESIASAKKSLPKATAQPTAAQTGSAALKPSQILSVDKAAKRVVMTIVAGDTNSNNGFNFDGYSKGAATFTVPAGWTVQFKFSNNQAVPHSVALATSHGATPSLASIGGKTVSSPNPTTGTTKGTKQVITFKAASTGHYYLVCDVPGHAVAGMWDLFTVSSSASTPSVSTSGT